MESLCSDYIQLYTSIPPKIAVSKFIGYLEGKSALMLPDMHPDLFGKWDKMFWARECYVNSSTHCRLWNFATNETIYT